MKPRRKPVVFLRGLFRITGSDGLDVEITSRKAKALFILLATSETGSRERRWLESHLWSDRDPEKAASNLRQALSALRRGLAGSGISLCANRSAIRLDLHSLIVETSGSEPFLDGFSVGDPVFQAWLDQERARHDGRPPKVVRPQQSVWRVNIELSDREGPNGWFSLTFADVVARGLRETQNTPVSVDAQVGPSDRLLTIAVNTMQLQDGLGVRVSLDRRASGRQIWSGQRLLPLQGGPPTDDPHCLSLANELVGAVDQYLYRNSHKSGLDEPDRLFHQAVRDLFSMQSDRVAAADALLGRASELSERGLFLALRAQLKAIERVEQFNVDTQALIDEARVYSERAFELEPENSMVMALLANTAGHLFQDQERSLDLAQRSVDLNPANPMAWWALSSATMYAGHHQRALQCALKGQRLSTMSQHRFWWDQQSFGSLFVLGHHEEAYKFLKTAHVRNLNYRPAMRYLFALAAHFDDTEFAEDCIKKLQISEPGFSVQRMIEDRSYPASLVHTAPNFRYANMKAFVD